MPLILEQHGYDTKTQCLLHRVSVLLTYWLLMLKREDLDELCQQTCTGVSDQLNMQYYHMIIYNMQIPLLKAWYIYVLFYHDLHVFLVV